MKPGTVIRLPTEEIQRSLSENDESHDDGDETADEILKLPSDLSNMTTVLLPICVFATEYL